MLTYLITGRVLRRPSASRTPSGKLRVMPTTARIRVNINPPHSPGSTKGANDHVMPSRCSSTPPCSRMKVSGRLSSHARASQREGMRTLSPIR